MPRIVEAHGGAPPAPHDLWTAWNWQPIILLGMALSAILYARGVYVFWRRAGPNRGIRSWQVAAFATGFVALFAALIWPLDALGDALFAGHMAQHVVLVVVAGPLLVLGYPLLAFLMALPTTPRRMLIGWWRRRRLLRSVWAFASGPLVTWILHTLAIWLWHIPALYQASVRSDLVHAAQHMSFLGTALLYWWALYPAGGRGRLLYAAGILSVFTMAVQNGMLGTLLVFARVPFYPVYASSVGAWGLTLLEDQQLAGSIMRVGNTLAYVVAAIGLLAAALHESERVARRREQRDELLRGSYSAMPVDRVVLSSISAPVDVDGAGR